MKKRLMTFFALLLALGLCLSALAEDGAHKPIGIPCIVLVDTAAGSIVGIMEASVINAEDHPETCAFYPGIKVSNPNEGHIFVNFTCVVDGSTNTTETDLLPPLAERCYYLEQYRLEAGEHSIQWTILGTELEKATIVIAAKRTDAKP